MSTEVRRYDTAPAPPPDESYWTALLAEADTAIGGIPQNGTNGKGYSAKDDFASKFDEEGSGSGGSADWEQVEQVFRSDTVVELAAIGYNRGGILVEWASLRGFVPASQLVEFPSDHESPNTRRQALMSYLGKTLRLRIIELDRVQSRLILSERAAQANVGARDQVLQNLKTGDVCQGIVTNLCHFGAFVDLGGLEGLIHISELSWGRVGHPADILERGQTIKVHVLDVVPTEGRIALSVKRLQPDPWETVEKRYQVGSEVEGVITHVVDFGAFVCIENGLEGLVHISELAEGHFLHPFNVVREGQTVKARILHIDGPGRRLGLSLRR